MKTNKEKWIFTAILAVIEIFLTAAELGFFTIGKIAFTILHIPVFIAVIEIGLLQGFILAAIFGVTRLPVSGSSDLRTSQAVDPFCRMAHI